MKPIYLKLAFDGIRKNHKLYIPYILAGSIMIMMYYILSALSNLPLLLEMRGGNDLAIFLDIGRNVVAIFSLLFLFYTNSFIIRRRDRKLGLYNVLGMGKRNIARVVLWESVFVALASVAVGIMLGVFLTKLSEIMLLRIVKGMADYNYSIDLSSVGLTAMIYGELYLILLVSSLVKIIRSKPLELLKSSSVGEKPPKANWLTALLGLILLVAAYYLAVTIKDPLTAVMVFFCAVVMVIIATYMLFISGSVAFCRILQKNKSYYYRPNHFVSVSSMAYRMKRNGAGLASICILCTMVLVTMSSTACLYIGEETVLYKRYPMDINVTYIIDGFEAATEENFSQYRSVFDDVEKTSEQDYFSVDVSGIINDGVFDPTIYDYNFNLGGYENLVTLEVMSLSDYNAVMGTREELEPRECLIYADRISYRDSEISVINGETYQIKKRLTASFDNDTVALLTPTVRIIVNDIEDFVRPLESIADYYGDQVLDYYYRVGFDLKDKENALQIASKLFDRLNTTFSEKDETKWRIEPREGNRQEFYSLYGGLFFLGITLSGVFMVAAVLIIYYKQISEGYEDIAKFDIMRRVGMTSREIKKSINSQVLTVFFAPLLTAGLHLTFAFPLIYKLLLLFGFTDVWLLAGITLGSFAVFAIAYAIVYKLTAGTYYRIVS